MPKPKSESVLSLDLGKRRIGIAGCDPLGITVTRLTPMLRTNFPNDLKQIKQHCLERGVKGLVIGIPLDAKGNETSQSKFCQQYAIRLANALKLPLAFVNEHCSTLEAKEKLNLYYDRSGKIDSEAAGLLLEQWLNEGPVLSWEFNSINQQQQNQLYS